MKKRGYGFQPPAASSAPKKMNLAQRLETERLQRLAEVARITVPSSPIPSSDAPLPTTERDNRPLEQRMGLDAGADRDAELDRRKQAAIADPESPESRASESWAARVAEANGWDDIARDVYALALRSVTIPKQCSIPVTVAVAGERRVNTSIMGYGDLAPPEGYAWFYPGNLNPWLILGLQPPGLQPMVTPSYSPLTQAPSQMLTGPQWQEITRRKERFYAQAEPCDYVIWRDRGTLGYLKL
jgi:hypothetical protein